MKRTNGYGTLIGTGALGGAAIVLGVATLSAISGDTTGMEAPVASSSASAPAGSVEREIRDSGTESIPAPATVQWEDVQLATELAPFEEDRVWTGERYLLPGERVASQPVEAQPERELEPPPAFEVLGTASSGASGLAIIRVGNGTPQLVALGQRVEGYEVASIEGERVTMRNTERSLSLSVASASPTGPVNERNDRRGPTRNRDNDRGNANDPRAVRNTGARAIPGVANGAIEAMDRNFERVVEAMGPGTRVQINGNQAVVSGPNGQQRIIVGGQAGQERSTQIRFGGAAPQQPVQRGR